MSSLRNGLIRASSFSLICALLCLGWSSSAMAKPIHPYSPGDLQTFCSNFGGVYFPPQNGIYACHWDDHVIVCGSTGCSETLLVTPGTANEFGGVVVVGVLDLQKKVDDLTTQVENLSQLVSNLIIP